MKLGHCGQTTRNTIGGGCSIVKLVPRSTSLLALFVEHSGKWLELTLVHITVSSGIVLLFYALYTSNYNVCDTWM